MLLNGCKLHQPMGTGNTVLVTCASAESQVFLASLAITIFRHKFRERGDWKCLVIPSLLEAPTIELIRRRLVFRHENCCDIRYSFGL